MISLPYISFSQRAVSRHSELRVKPNLFKFYMRDWVAKKNVVEIQAKARLYSSEVIFH